MLYLEPVTDFTIKLFKYYAFSFPLAIFTNVVNKHKKILCNFCLQLRDVVCSVFIKEVLIDLFILLQPSPFSSISFFLLAILIIRSDYIH